MVKSTGSRLGGGGGNPLLVGLKLVFMVLCLSEVANRQKFNRFSFPKGGEERQMRNVSFLWGPIQPPSHSTKQAAGQR